MNKQIFRTIVIVSFLISIASGVVGFYYPTEVVVAFNEFYIANYTVTDPSMLTSYIHLFGVALMFISVFGMLFFWRPSREMFVLAYFFMLPGYFFEPLFVYPPIAQILYDIGMITSGLILAAMYLEPINSIFNQKSNKSVKQTD